MRIMDIEEAIYKRRTIRRFRQDSIPLEILKKLVDLARVAPAAKNVQCIEFIIVNKPKKVEQMFPLVKWAAALPKDKREPEPGRTPTAYIIILVNTHIKQNYYEFDIGAAVQNLLLGAVKYGIGSCWMGSIDGNKIRALFEVPEYYEIPHVISLGYPDEDSKMEPYKDSFDYWKDENGMMHVPKRSLEEVIFKIS
ncbi:MAG: nitroreductase family protein [Promethearchaeota archaeon]|nr:MAG: nitroreductase family protein [Candidatus Lokiarchaeota archaeon]